MSDNFNFSRFGKYFVHDLKKQQKNIGMLMLIFGLFPIIFYMIYIVFGTIFNENLIRLLTGTTIEGPSIGARLGVFAGITIIFVMLYPSRAYGEITDKAKGSEWLMLPASRLEKFVSMTLMTLVVIPIIFIIAYLLSDAVVCLFDKTCGDSIFSFRINDVTNTSDLILPANGFWILAANIIEYASIFLLGGLIFKKWKTVGTALVLFALSMLGSFAFGIFISNADLDCIGEWMSEWAQRHADYIDLWVNGFVNLCLFLIVAACETASWFRIKRIQH